MTENCVVCGRKLGSDARTYALTAQERRLLTAMGQKEDPSYCPGCDKVMRDPKLAAELMRGVWLTKYRAAGVPLAIAEERANKMYDFMLSHALQKKPS